MAVVAYETTTSKSIYKSVRDRDSNVCTMFVWVLMRHAPALISPSCRLSCAPTTQPSKPPSHPTCGKCFSLMMPRKISNLYELYSFPRIPSCCCNIPPTFSHPLPFTPCRSENQNHIETLCTYLSFISFVVWFSAT